MPPERLERLRRRAAARPLVILLRLAVPLALLALYAASSGARSCATRAELASAAPPPATAGAPRAEPPHGAPVER